MSRAHTILLLFLPGLALSKTFLHHPYVSIPGGASYQGVWINGTSTYPFASFQGIRYAQPPTGDLRFYFHCYSAMILFFNFFAYIRLINKPYVKDGGHFE